MVHRDDLGDDRHVLAGVQWHGHARDGDAQDRLGVLLEAGARVLALGVPELERDDDY